LPYDGNSLDPTLGDRDFEFEHPNSLLANPVDAILLGLGVGTFYEPV
jgi:hypothetical protein